MFTARLIGKLRDWDRPSKIALGTAVILLGMVVLAAAFGPSNWRQPAVIGIAGLVIMLQLIVMWGNRGMVTPYTRAQREFLAGNLEAARDILEASRGARRTDVQTLTLLGNTYRQLGDLDASETILREAIAMRPSHYFPFYGFGRTLLSKGLYTEAGDAIQEALRLNAPPVIQFDLGELRYRQGLYEDARAHLQVSRPYLQEPYRVLMADYLLYRMNASDAPAVELVKQGLPYWRAAAERFSHTPYGQSLVDDVRWMQAQLEGN